MPEPTLRRRRAHSVGGSLRAIALASALAVLVPAAASAAAPATAPDDSVAALVPGEQGPGTPGGGGGFDLGLIVVVVVAAVVAAAALATVGYLVLRRRARAPLEHPPGAPEAGEWWTCRQCGRNNIVGSARCYACGAWQR